MVLNETCRPAVDSVDKVIYSKEKVRLPGLKPIVLMGKNVPRWDIELK